jgi:uncharacterized protein
LTGAGGLRADHLGAAQLNGEIHVLRLLPRYSLIKRLLLALTVLGALTACGTAALQHEEERLTFRVVRETPGWYNGLPAGVQEFDLPVGDEAKAPRFHAWWWPCANPNAPAVLYLHGARWSLTGQVFRLEQLRDFGFSVLAIDYRGFGKSDGDLPSEKTVYEDARVAWTWLIREQPKASRRFIYGHSLGGAVAVDLAAAVSRGGDGAPAAGGLIIESTFTTLADMAREITYSWMPVGLLLTQKFDSVGKMKEVRMPVLVVHGSADRYVPFRFSKTLYEAAPGPKRYLLIEGGSHNNSMRTGAGEYRRALHDLFGIDPAGDETSSTLREDPLRRRG